MFMHSAKSQLALLRLGQNQGQQPRHQNLPVERYQTCRTIEAKFSEEWTCLRHLPSCESAIKLLFAVSTDIHRFTSVLLIILGGDSHVNFKVVFNCFQFKVVLIVSIKFR